MFSVHTFVHTNSSDLFLWTDKILILISLDVVILIESIICKNPPCNQSNYIASNVSENSSSQVVRGW